MKSYRADFIRSVLPAAIGVILMTSVKLAEHLTGLSLTFLGVKPLHTEGLPGILLAPFVHDSFDHLYSNIVPFFFLTTLLFYFYRDIAGEVLTASWILPGLLVWAGARDSWHIGASGVVYALTAFHLVSGIVRKNPRLSAISLLMIFLYGGFIWGIFPDFFPGRNISWESHLGGLITGVILAVFFRRNGPPDPTYSWDEEDDEPENQPPVQDDAGKASESMINFIYHKDKP